MGPSRRGRGDAETPGAEGGRTAPSLVVERARRHPTAVAFRSKHLGLYRERTWTDACELVARCALGFLSLGVSEGDRVAILADPCEEWLVCDLAAQAAGAVSCGIYPTASEEELVGALRETGATVLVVQGLELLERIRPLLPRLPRPAAVVAFASGAEEGALSYAQLLARGAESLTARGETGAAALERLAAALDPAAPAVMQFTAGSTGPCRSALLSHGGQLAAGRELVRHYPVLRRPGHRTVAYLPPAHVLGRESAILLPLVSGIVPHFGESVEDLPRTLFETAPTVLFTVPRLLRKLCSRIQTGIAGTGGFKRRACDAALSLGRRHAERRWRGSASALQGASYRALHAAVLRPILGKIGFDRLELVLCGGAPLVPEVAAFWQALGVNVAEIYCHTEAGGSLVAGQPGAFPEPGDVGKPAAGRSCSIAEGGEILVRAEAEGGDWCSTGDLGELQDGSLRILGRACDFFATDGGVPVSPCRIERALCASPFIAEAVAVGEGRPFPAALLELDVDAAACWADDRKLAYAGGADGLSRHPELLDLVKAEVERANGRLAEHERVRAFRLLPAGLDLEAETLVTPLYGVRRPRFSERFEALIGSMYDATAPE
ncbi:MAG: AMP-binding protein [Deltaproteobacteria bacterium]|nr:AMP-binding protein [Deltaproteobacteria bacterium]